MRPFRNILFAADFSENSKDAFRVACSLAVENKTRLSVLHLAEPNWVPETPVYLGDPTVHFVASWAESHLEALKQNLREVYTPNHPIDVAYFTRGGDAQTEILRFAEEIASDLIVTGTHGRTGTRWLLAGSVAIAVLRGARCPVLALRSPAVPRKVEEIRFILHPTDFSEYSEMALQVARSLARDLGARLLILHVAPLDVLLDEDETPAAELDPRIDTDALEGLPKRLDGPDLKFPVETRIRRGSASDEILATAGEVECDLIVMGTHGRTGLDRALVGSVAESVLTTAECPVVIVKARCC
jgi:nucleotide-binding universal stress UspA family protein